MKNVKTIQRSLRARAAGSIPACSSACSHFNIDQNTSAVKKEDNAYTSPSTALNQNESEKVYTKAPMTPALITVKSWLLSSISPVFTNILRAKWVTLQNRNRIVAALAMALIKLTALAAVIPLSPKRIIKKRPRIAKNGAP